MRRYHYNENFYIILLVLIAFIISCHQITIPFIDAMATDGSSLGNMVRNFLRYSVFETKFGIVTNPGLVIEGDFNYAIDHPMFLFVSIVSVFCRIFGIHEWSLRLVPILFSMGNLIMIYILASKVWDKKTGFLSIFFMAFFPMSAFYTARDVWPYSMGIFLSLVLIWFYVSWVREYERKYFLGVVIIHILSLFTLWDIYFLGPILFLYHILSKKEKLSLVFILPLLNVIVFTLIFMHTHFLLGSLEEMRNLFLLRSGATNNVTFLQFVTLEFSRSLKYFTFIPCLLSLIGIWNEIRLSQNRNIGDKLFLFLFAWGIPFSLLFQQGAMHQINWICTWSPFIALSGARGFIFLQESVFPRIFNNWNMAKRFYQLLSIFAILGCIFLGLHKSSQSDIGPYSSFALSFLILWIAMTVGIILFTWSISKNSRQDLVEFFHPLTVILLILFLSQSTPTIWSLFQKRSFRLDHKIATIINENTEFEDAVLTSIDLYRYSLPYYADRYIVTHLRTKDDYFEVLKRDKQRSFKYYITTDWELMNTAYFKNNKISELNGEYLKTKGITMEPCELDEYISNNYTGKVIGSLIYYDLSTRKVLF